ncbi:hypothetical protein Bca4012_088943 [Brassica carinata]|uniref:(rape) hypothetical protein n=1 Tax=Brassica napus TaxID=3708 RepID=A0A816RDG6_BRANA|nr:unnamed protein product [Brassica napus]
MKRVRDETEERFEIGLPFVYKRKRVFRICEEFRGFEEFVFKGYGWEEAGSKKHQIRWGDSAWVITNRAIDRDECSSDDDLVNPENGINPSRERERDAECPTRV